MRRFLLPVAVVLLAASAGRAQPQELSDELIQRSIDDGIRYLEESRQPDGGWGDFPPTMPGGVTALCVTALRASGVPPHDERIRKPLEQLRKIEPKYCYQAAVQTLAFCLCEPDNDRLLIQRNVAFLEKNQIRSTKSTNGSWNYGHRNGSPLGPGDNSNTQWALLALHEAERCGVPTNDGVWLRARQYWIKSQHPDGSWGYVPNTPGTGSMTCAGVTSLLLAAEKLDRADAAVEGETIACCGKRRATKSSPVERGLKWLEKQFTVAVNPGDTTHHLLYYLCGLERVGRLTNRRLIGGNDWYREGATQLLQSQARPQGHWKGFGSGESREVIGTSMALVFLAQGRRPVAAVKLSFGFEDQWNRHGRDLAYLVDHCAARWKRPLTRQVATSAGAANHDLNVAPVVFISGSEPSTFGQREVKALRQYVDNGGTIFAENCCAGREFDASFRSLAEQMFPERDAAGERRFRLRELPPEHAIYRAEEAIDLKRLSTLPEGVEFGGRTAVIYYPANLGCYWELDRPGRTQNFPQPVEDAIRAHRSLGINVMAYAGARNVKSKLAER
jgi:hypothetical protein